MTRLRVLQSFPAPRATTNPFLPLLLGSLPPQVRCRTFSWPAALLGGYDVLHLHWPETLLRGRDAGRTGVRQLLFLLLLLRVRLTRVALVRTVHNSAPHEPGGRRERLLLGWCDRLTTLQVQLSPVSRSSLTAPSVTILHGHYREWFHDVPLPAPLPGRLLYVGLIRTYKGVPALVAAFAGLDDPAATLRVVGSPVSPALQQEVERACAADPRCAARLEYVDDRELAAELGRAELVVLPYREMDNSGALLLALSLARPVLVPAGAANTALADEVGAGWVLTYDGALDAAALGRALSAVRSASRGAAPDLSRRDWPALGEQYLAAYEAAVTLSGRVGGAGSRRRPRRT